MKLLFQHRHDPRSPSFSALIASELESLRATLHIDQAGVRMTKLDWADFKLNPRL